MGSLMFYCPQDSISAIFEKRLTDRRTDEASYRDAWTHLKMGLAMSDALDMLGNILGKFPGHTRHLGYVILFAAILLF